MGEVEWGGGDWGGGIAQPCPGWVGDNTISSPTGEEINVSPVGTGFEGWHHGQGNYGGAWTEG